MKQFAIAFLVVVTMVSGGIAWLAALVFAFFYITEGRYWAAIGCGLLVCLGLTAAGFLHEYTEREKKKAKEAEG